ncbi:aldehyde dehydrogenase family protein [Ramlibacter algicola]|uniref:Aldehyde dehydrogenase family protein n=1 Tax=Ramlibacter algicola TaxID=2795217 RepID=A0A934PXZ8_9BURK|nr:aldehyde dehydrogenase family protein [Ramlibacter algicola]MBK0392554.1 aldehyde dehydrogenase family protein [Ramlibacter algicola]
MTHAPSLPTTAAPGGHHHVGGQWRAGASSIEVTCPADGAVLARLAAGDAADIDAAVRAAREALAGPWGRLSATARGRLLCKLADAVLRDVERLAWIEALDTGKPITLARNDVKVLARYLEYYGTAADKVLGQVIPFEPGYSVKVVREPHGVTGHIIPWNYPVQMFGRSVAPALAMGNACVVKPAEDASLTSLEIAALALEAGFPAGVLNVVTGYGDAAGAALAAHPDINYISFTGSPRVGALVQQAAAVNSVRVCLELGGKSPQVVFADADLDRCAATVVKAITQNAGQTCSAGSRVLVQRAVFDEFMQKVAAGFEQLRVGDPWDDPDLGPVINRVQRQRVQRYVDQAIAEGVPVLGRARVADSLLARGHFVAPIVFGPVPRDNAIACEEVFGPVLAALAFDDEEDAVALANGTDYGLVAAVWTRDGDRAARLVQRLAAGQCFINCYGAGGGVELPFGGVKRSGHGREKGLLALEDMSTTKTIVHFHG